MKYICLGYIEEKKLETISESERNAIVAQLQIDLSPVSRPSDETEPELVKVAIQT